MNKILELMQKRAQAVADARAFLDKAQGEKREMSQEEQNSFDAAMAEAERLAKQLDNEQRVAGQEATVNGEQRSAGRADMGRETATTGDHRSTPEYNTAFDRFLRGGFASLGPTDQRALQSDLDTAGGYLVTPTQWVAGLLQAVDDEVFVRQHATIIQVPTAQSLGVPSLDNDPADPTWTAEIATGTEDSTMSFGKRELHPHPLAKRIKLSNKLLRQVPDAAALAQRRLAYKFGITMEQAYLTGTGANQPLGIFTVSANGLTTARDVATGNTAATPTFDGLIEAKYALKGKYWANARWLFHRSVMKLVAKIKDGEGVYMWQPSLIDGQPDRLMNIPVDMSEFAPSTIGASNYVGALCDWSQYWIADALDFQVQRLVELYAEANQVGIIGRAESDGMPVLAEAFVRVQLGS